MAKIQPAVLSIQFTVGEGVGPRFIDISQAASICNRRFYRQGLNWAVAGFTVSSVALDVGSLTISKIPNTWMASNSWHKTYAAWKRQQDEALAEGGAFSAVAKYRDFKIACNPIQAALTTAAGVFANNLIPVDKLGAAFSQGEWQASQIVIPNAGGVVGDTDVFFLHMVGGTIGTSQAMITNYAGSRAFPQSPDPVSGAPEDSFFSEMFNVGMDDEEIIENATGKNDDLPYDQDNYPGGSVNAPTLEIVHDINLVTSVGSTTRKLSGTNVPCGLLMVESLVDGPIDLYVHLVPGSHRGYMAQPMQDM